MTARRLPRCVLTIYLAATKCLPGTESLLCSKVIIYFSGFFQSYGFIFSHLRYLIHLESSGYKGVTVEPPSNFYGWQPTRPDAVSFDFGFFFFFF